MPKVNHVLKSLSRQDYFSGLLKVRDIVDGVFKRTLTLLESNLDLLEQSAQDLLQRETLDEPDLVAIGSTVKRTEAVAA